MRYTIKQLSRLTGLTTRALRYYDEIGLLCPVRDCVNDYRLYTKEEVDRLQQILLYREMGLPLEEIHRILDQPDYDRVEALRTHLTNLLSEQKRVDALIRTVSRTLKTLEGGTDMSDMEKFEGMKQRIIQENEAAYGQEIRQRYGDQAVDAANRHIKGMTGEEWERMKTAESSYQEALRRAVASGDPASADAMEACSFHKEWLRHYWPPEMLTAQNHIGLVSMYDEDERFRAYYEAIAPGCAAFFAKAIRIYYAACASSSI